MKALIVADEKTAFHISINILSGESYLFLKRLFDVFGSLSLLLFFSPIFGAVALGIRLFSPGPIFYKQTRIGKNGKPFGMLKFRSMRLENNPDLHREYVQRLIKENIFPCQLENGSLKLKSDPRITGIGRIIRKFSLDELPQFLNVLRGEMSIVGPRPPLPYELDCYAEWHKKRLAVLPGITGLWQVTAHNSVCFDDMVRIDLEYITHMNIWLDLKLLFLTPFEMIRGKGSG
jgi:lipopolysaccharide/colanic/teichoic acid biosynthesis glycosyltransferase